MRFPSIALAHVSHFFPEREPWALKQSTHFSIFECFEILHQPYLLVSLAPLSPSVKNFDVVSSFVRLFRSFQVHVQGVRAIVHVAIQVHAVESRTATQPRHHSHLRSTCADLPAFAISKCFFSFLDVKMSMRDEFALQNCIGIQFLGTSSSKK